MGERGDQGTWLCPTPFDRTRLLDMEARLSRQRVLMYGAIAAALLMCGPSLGWWVLLPLAVVVASYFILAPRVAGSERPEYIVAATVAIAQVMIGVGIALTGGPHSPAIALLLLPMVTLPARFGTHGVQAGMGASLVVMLASTVGVDPAAAVANPEHVVIAISALIGLSVFADGLRRAEVESRSDSSQDVLTGLLNRKALMTHFGDVAKQASMTGRDVCVVLIDLDDFKAVNDGHGHSRGDAVLRDAAAVLRENLRTFELLYRVGGEEFLVLMPGVDRPGGRTVADRLRSALEAARPGDLEVTASFGVAVATGTAVEYDALFDAADAALYRAKDEGRNRVVLAPELRPDPERVPVAQMAPAAARSVSVF